MSIEPKPIQTIEFNTGRLYSAEGQFIKATLHDDDVVTFFDHSRGVDGQFPNNATFDSTTVMSRYDSRAFRSTSRSWRDGMTRGGCNAR